jgi:crossover junction endodeoxyribonuclease RuvC
VIQNNMKVLAIDPGYDRLGIAILEDSPNGEILHHSSCFETNKKADLADRLLALGTHIEELIIANRPDCVAIETLFFNKNITTAIGVAQARGVIMYLARKHNCLVYEFGPQEIKVAITGYGKSDKQAVIMMIKRLVKNAPEAALDDEYDAIAVGVTCLAHHA